MPNSVASRSMWTTLPSGLLMRLFWLYVLSENLLPTDMIRSASFMAWRADILPCIPSGPMQRSYVDGTTPMLMRVVSTGAWRSSESSMTSLYAFTAPPPTRIIGRFAALIHWTASSNPERSSHRGLMPYSSSRTDSSTWEFIWSTGRSMWTGPGRPVWHISQASLTAWGSLFTSRTLKLCLVMGIMTLYASTSWKAPRPREPVPTWPVNASIGTESANAVATPVTRLVAPGPLVARHTPGLPEALAYPSAMCAAHCSCLTRMCLRFASYSSS